METLEKSVDRHTTSFSAKDLSSSWRWVNIHCPGPEDVSKDHALTNLPANMYQRSLLGWSMGKQLGKLFKNN